MYITPSQSQVYKGDLENKGYCTFHDCSAHPRRQKFAVLMCENRTCTDTLIVFSVVANHTPYFNT